MIYLKAYLGTALAFLALDVFWLGYAAKGFYASRLGELLRPDPDLKAAAIFYTLYVAGVVFFAVKPALSTSSLATAAIHGALLGLLAYATYDLTNLATLKGWPIRVVVVDIVWGTVLTGLAASAGYLLARTGGPSA